MKKLLSLLLCLCLLAAIPAAFAAPIPTGDIVVLYTNDVHCGVDQGFGYAGLVSYREKLLGEGHAVTLVDLGDSIQGEPIGTLSAGAYLIELMNQAGYDLAIPGNHEFDYGMDRFLELAEAAQFPYLSVNFVKGDEPVLAPYQIVDYSGVKVAYLGLTTPKTLTSSTPKYFQDDSGNFIYGFLQDESGQKLYDAVQNAVDSARAEGADYVVVLGHLGIAEETSPWMSTEIIANTTGIDVVLDAHSHSVLPCERVQNKAGGEVLLSSTGTKLQNIGVLRIKADGTMDTSLYVWNGAMAKAVSGIKSQFDEILSEVVAKSDVDLVINEPGSDPPVRIIRVAETNLGDLCADAYRAMSGADIAFVNGGGIRTTIPAGDISYDAILKVHPYGNALCMVEASGQEILDALEMGSRVVPGENGGFLQVSGLTYEIHTYIESSVKLNDEGLFVAVEGEYRVQNVKVGGEDLDLEKTYTLASHDYLLKNAGDGFTMFQDNVLLLDSIMLDNQVLINYIIQSLGGVVGEQYANPYGEGRIVAIAE